MFIYRKVKSIKLFFNSGQFVRYGNKVSPMKYKLGLFTGYIKWDDGDRANFKRRDFSSICIEYVKPE